MQLSVSIRAMCVGGVLVALLNCSQDHRGFNQLRKGPLVLPESLDTADLVVLGVPTAWRELGGRGLVFRAQERLGISAETVVEIEVTLNVLCVLGTDSSARGVQPDEIKYNYSFPSYSGMSPPANTAPFRAIGRPGLFFLRRNPDDGLLRGVVDGYGDGNGAEPFLDVQWVRKEKYQCGPNRARCIERLFLSFDRDRSDIESIGSDGSLDRRVGTAMRLLGFTRPWATLVSLVEDTSLPVDRRRDVCATIAAFYPLNVPSVCDALEPYRGSAMLKERASQQLLQLRSRGLVGVAQTIHSNDSRHAIEYIELLKHSSDSQVRKISAMLSRELLEAH